MTNSAQKKKQAGPGRPRLDGKPVSVTLSMTEKDRDDLRELGGSAWVRTAIRQATGRKLKK